MAIKTGAIFHSLIYGGIDSADYGIYITGDAVYNTPERAVELVSVPGRNGAVAIDQGHWENIDVEYSAGVFGDDQTDFATAISDFRNAICSQLGYQRLTDSYNPNEYRMALYTEGLEIDPVRRDNGFAGEFTIKFNAKPQRWLTSGEDAVSVTSGDELVNPTQYASSPLLAVGGYGDINFNGYTITLINEVMGHVELLSGQQYFQQTKEIEFSEDTVNNGDPITLDGAMIIGHLSAQKSGGVTYYFRYGTFTITDSNAEASSDIYYPSPDTTSSTSMDLNTNVGAITFTSGVDDTWTNTATYIGEIWGGTLPSSPKWPVTIVDDQTISYTKEKITITHEITVTTAATQVSIRYDVHFVGAPYDSYGDITAESTASLLGNPTYIDCDLGEAYMIKNGSIVSLNAYIDLGSDLPTLASGSNEITYDNTVTSLDVTPNWWKL